MSQELSGDSHTWRSLLSLIFARAWSSAVGYYQMWQSSAQPGPTVSGLTKPRGKDAVGRQYDHVTKVGRQVWRMPCTGSVDHMPWQNHIQQAHTNAVWSCKSKKTPVPSILLNSGKVLTWGTDFWFQKSCFDLWAAKFLPPLPPIFLSSVAQLLWVIVYLI